MMALHTIGGCGGLGSARPDGRGRPEGKFAAVSSPPTPGGRRNRALSERPPARGFPCGSVAGGVCGLASALLLLATVLTGCAGEAQAQTQTVVDLYKNVLDDFIDYVYAGDTSRPSIRRQQAMAFTTGPNDEGYTLSSVRIWVWFYNKIDNADPPVPGGRPRVSIYTNSSGSPGTSKYLLTTPTIPYYAPDDDYGYTTYDFNAPANATLDANTTYFVVFEDAGTDGEWNIGLQHREDPTETMAAGWSAGARYLSKDSGGDWGNGILLRKIYMELTGFIGPAPDPALDLAVDGEVTAGAGDRYFFTRDDFKFKESGGTALRKIYINSLPDDGWLWVKGWRLEPRHLPVTVRVDSLDYEVVLYFAPNGSTPRATTFAFDVSAGRLKSESNYTMTVNIAPRGVEPVIPGDNVIQSTIGQLTYPVAQEVDATRSVAQPLTTGMNDPAYDLGSIVVQFADPPGTGTPDFALYTAIDGGSFGLPMPGTKITDLEEGSAEGKLRTFTPASAVDLAAGTTYFVVFRASGGSIKLASTASKHDDDGFTHVTIDRYARAGPWGEWTRPTTRLRAKMALLDEVFEFSVEADPPTVEGTPVLSGAGDDGTWSEGETVRVALSFSESVDVDTSAGTPSVGIDLGAAGTTETERSAEYESGSGTSTLTFAYTLVAGDGSHTSMAVTPDSLTLGGGTIRSSETAFDALLGHVGAAAMGSNARSTGPQANFHNVPENHDGETPFTLTVAFGGAPDGLSPKRDAGSTFEVEGGAITKSRQAPGQSSGTWELTVRPSGTGGVTLRVPARSCGEAHAVCINGRALPEAAEVTIAGMQGTDNAITAQVTAASASHDGSASFEIEFEFSHAPRSLSYRTVRDDLFDVTGGRIANASRLTRGESLGWRLTVQPDGNGAVTIDARATSDCEAAYAVCDAEGRMFDGGLEHTVPGPAPEPESETLPVVSIAAGETPVNEGTDLSFTLSRTGSTDDALTVNVTVSESGDVLAGSPPTSATFAAGSATATLSVATVDDETEEDTSTVTATLAAGTGYAVDADAGAAEGQVESEDLAPITARFSKRCECTTLISA